MRFLSSSRRLTAALPVALAALTLAVLPGRGSAQNASVTVGTGANTSFFVLDFKDGSAAPSHLFAYKWDPAGGMSPTGAQMIDAFAAANIGFSYTFTDFGPGLGIFYDGFTYGAQNRTRPAGSFSQYWGYWSSTNGIAWNGSQVGATGRALSNGSWDGWSFGPNGGTAPVTPASAFAPEPGAAALLLFGGAGVAAVRRRRRATRRDA